MLGLFLLCDPGQVTLPFLCFRTHKMELTTTTWQGGFVSGRDY